ncbi:unnamed protein product [Polarella glacialis]|uniref:ATP-dependent transporter ycf16 n=1 Tax=Polarella glacialis TaxID=89957 RepID=A0A813KQG0_POLGL|nr:unnamed protein product [Polarella glacialis]
MSGARELGDRSGSGMNVPLVSNGEGAHADQEDASWPENSAGGGAALETTAGIWSRITFGWLSPLIAEGYRRELRRASPSEPLLGGDELPAALTEGDLCELRRDDLPQVLSATASRAWAEEVALPGQERSLRRALRKSFGGPFFAAAGFKFCYDTLQMVGPYILKEVLGYLGRCEEQQTSMVDKGDCNLGEGLFYVSLMSASALVQTALLHQYFQLCFRSGIRANAAAISLIYRKALRTSGPGKRSEGNGSSPASPANSPPASQHRSTGEIVNLMAVDSQRLQDTMTYLHTLWSGPYQIIITLIFLHYVVGWATAAGVVVMLLQIPFVTFVARRIKLAQRALMGIKDERIKLTHEVFGSIRLLKMYGWEDSFEKRLDDIRERELTQLRKYQILNIVSGAVWATAPIITGLATFAVYSALYGRLSPATAFTALSLLNVLRFPLTMFPNMVSSASEAQVALQRIQQFLEGPEVAGRLPPPGESGDSSLTTGPPRAKAVVLDQVQLEWPNGTPLLASTSFSVPAPMPGQERAHLTVVMGTVGAGKSGLLQALIGDVSPVRGILSTSGRIAYSSQVAWTRNATVRDNIIFNSPFNEERYADVLSACQLLPDLEAFPNGEFTEIGEKGVTLSGGQKQRVSLARAVYAGADLLLLDDPLSAVDAEVAKKLLKMLRSKLVSQSSVVLCTHHQGAVKYADQVILLQKSVEAGDSTSGTVTQMAFCGAADEFVRRFPHLSAPDAGDGLTRQISPDDVAPEASPKNAAEKGRLVQKEEEFVGSVTGDVYMAYVRAAGGPGLAVAVILGVFLAQALQTGADAWISVWSDHSKPDTDKLYVSSSEGLIVYTCLSFFAFAGVFCTSGLFRISALKAARSFQRMLLQHMLRLPMSFYDTTPLGRVLNRFSKDIYTIDEQLQSSLYSYLQVVIRVFATIIVIAVATPWFLAVIVPLLFVYKQTQSYYIPSSRQLKRIESNLRSPVFSHFSETLDGVSLIRAFGQQPQFLAESTDRVRRNMRAYYLNVSSNRWLAIRLETIGTLIVASAGTLAVLGRSTLSAGTAGLSISYALSVTQALNWVVRMAADRENNIVSVERVREYLRLPLEPPHRLPATDPPVASWPLEGRVELQEVQLRYRPELPLVLTGLSLTIEPREKLGICGRTGAGKSSVLNVLLRMVEPEAGRVLIDGVDIATLGLHCLRRSITIIPQDPVLFSGTLKFNLDPLAECADGDLWQALRRSHLAAHVATLAGSAPDGPASEAACLVAVVEEHGKNFSLGQRQQMCLARALLRSNRILLLDEATSAVDMQTDSLIQGTIRKEFSEHTVLCIAHRISTIMESDRVCVLEGGKLAEIGSPQELMRQEGSRFKTLAMLDASS